MTVIPDPHKKVPMMFRAQVNGRCQLQRLVKGEKPDAALWADEWVDKIDSELPDPSDAVQTRTYSIDWRLLTNAGTDDGVIRPIIGARGYPYYPGSSMKGLFRRACTSEQAAKYCGKRIYNEATNTEDWKPGTLRFHGGYPIDTSWTTGLVDIVHPQQNWQVETQNRTHKEGGAFVQISLYQPTLRFGISSIKPLSPEEWQEVWEIWERSLLFGLGGRVCAGYGQVAGRSLDREHILYKTQIKGQGQAPKLLDQTGEFRPNVFRSTLRGHALRIFGGLTDANTATALVETLFGGVKGSGTVGLLGFRFQPSRLEIGKFGRDRYAQPTYDVTGELTWMPTRSLSNLEFEALRKLVAKLMQFSIVLGGIGKSWRRADHRLFFPEYYDDAYKALIGCHWQWGKAAWRQDVQVYRLVDVGKFIDRVQQAAIAWMETQGVKPRGRADWREAWHPENVQVWGRLAQEESEAIRWFHGAYLEKIPGVQAEGSIYRTSLTGQVGQVGRLWHRMYPKYRRKESVDGSGKPLVIEEKDKFLELLTVFPDESPECEAFLAFLKRQPFGFEKLWGE